MKKEKEAIDYIEEKLAMLQQQPVLFEDQRTGETKVADTFKQYVNITIKLRKMLKEEKQEVETEDPMKAIAKIFEKEDKH